MLCMYVQHIHTSTLSRLVAREILESESESGGRDVMFSESAGESVKLSFQLVLRRYKSGSKRGPKGPLLIYGHHGLLFSAAWHSFKARDQKGEGAGCAQPRPAAYATASGASATRINC